MIVLKTKYQQLSVLIKDSEAEWMSFSIEAKELFNQLKMLENQFNVCDENITNAVKLLESGYSSQVTINPELSGNTKAYIASESLKRESIKKHHQSVLDQFNQKDTQAKQLRLIMKGLESKQTEVLSMLNRKKDHVMESDNVELWMGHQLSDKFA